MRCGAVCDTGNCGIQNSLNILAIFPGKVLCAVEARPEKAGGTLFRVTSAVLGLLERLALQALDGHIVGIFHNYLVCDKI